MSNKRSSKRLRESIARLIHDGLDDQAIAAQCHTLGSDLSMKLGVSPIREAELIAVIRGLMSRKPPAEVYRYWDVAMRHVTRADHTLLKLDSEWYLSDDCLSPGVERLLVAPKHQGFFICVPPDLDEEEEGLRRHGYSQALVSLLHQARNRDCQWVCLDVDGAVHKRLRRFSW